MEFKILTECPLFKGLSSSEVESIFAVIPFRTKKFKAGSLIAQSGEEVNSLMLVMNGTVKGEMVDYSGKLIKIEDIPAPGALAPAFVFGNRNRYPVNIIAVSDSGILIIEKGVFLKLLMKNDRILLNFLDMISNRSQFLSEKIKFLNFKTIKSKLAQYILKLDGDNKSFVRMDKTQNDLADYFGVARPSVARALHDLEETGFIKAEGKTVRILNRAGLTGLTQLAD
jgi:CRP/FNR family transcriptional regulator, dissimilatory nitrate respiration regulator